MNELSNEPNSDAIEQWLDIISDANSVNKSDQKIRVLLKRAMLKLGKPDEANLTDYEITSVEDDKTHDVIKRVQELFTLPEKVDEPPKTAEEKDSLFDFFNTLTTYSETDSAQTLNVVI